MKGETTMKSTKYNDQYFNILRTLLKKLNNGKDNLVLSPFSLMMLLAIAADATAGDTRDEIAKILCGDMDYEEVKETLSAIQSQLTKDDTLRSANAVIVREDYKSGIVEGYEDRLTRLFGGKLFAVKDIIPAVNAWVNEQTKGMIPKVVDDSMSDMLFSLINAITFEAEWEEEYEDADVINDDFTNADGTVSRVKMLRSYERTYLENKAFTGFVKPYKDTGFSYVALLPKKKGAVSDKAIKALDPLSFCVNPEAVVTAIMPEFTCEFDENMTSLFQELGMKTVFTEKADFSPFATDWLKAKAIIHKAHIEVDRKGTKAAAVSGIAGDAGALPDFDIEYKTVKLDRPFVYAIVYNDSGLPVFVGTINHLDALTGDDLMTEEEMWALQEDLFSQMMGEKYDGYFECTSGTPESAFYKRIRTACLMRDGKELRKIANEVSDYLKLK